MTLFMHINTVRLIVIVMQRQSTLPRVKTLTTTELALVESEVCFCTIYQTGNPKMPVQAFESDNGHQKSKKAH